MNLLYCAGCRHAFTSGNPGGPEPGTCVVCGAALRVIARDVIQVSPLGESNGSSAAENGACTVTLQRKQAGKGASRILEDLGRYFRVVATNAGAEVCIDRCPPIDAPWQVAAILDGIDGRWEDHFSLPQLDSASGGALI